MIYGIKRLRHLWQKWGKNFCISLIDMKMLGKPNDFTLFNPDFKAERIITCRSYYSRRGMYAKG